MRAMFGLVGLLVAVGILLVLFKEFEAPTLDRGRQAEDQARQISGRGTDGQAAIDSFKSEPQYRGSQLEGLSVTDVAAGGALAGYGLQKGDTIVRVNGMKVGDVSNNDPEMAKSLVQQAFERSQPIVVTRDGRTLTLPSSPGTATPDHAASAPPAGTAAPAPTTPPTAPPPQSHGLQDQLRDITGAARNGDH